MIMDNFSEQTLAHMEVALGKACELLPGEMDSHEVRKRIAEMILDRATQGDRSLASLTEAGIVAAVAVRRSSRRRRPGL